MSVSCGGLAESCEYEIEATFAPEDWLNIGLKVKLFLTTGESRILRAKNREKLDNLWIHAVAVDPMTEFTLESSLTDIGAGRQHVFPAWMNGYVALGDEAAITAKKRGYYLV